MANMLMSPLLHKMWENTEELFSLFHGVPNWNKKYAKHWTLINSCCWNLFYRTSINVRYNSIHLYINIQWCISKTQKNFILFIIVLGQHVSIPIESSSGPSSVKILKLHLSIRFQRNRNYYQSHRLGFNIHTCIERHREVLSWFGVLFSVVQTR